MKKRDILGQQFGAWVVIEARPSRKSGNGVHSQWFCRCRCGTEKTVSGSNLLNGGSKSCGCAGKSTPTSKICALCFVDKPLSEFYGIRNPKHRPVYCKACNSLRATAAYVKNPDRLLRSKIYAANLRKEVLAAYGGKCICCGEDDPVFLAIDHVHGGGTQELKQMTSRSFYGSLRRRGFPQDDFQCLCHNCNFAKHVTKGNCPHKHARVEALAGVLGFGA